MHSQDVLYMRMALAQAEKGRYTARPNPAVGCIIVHDGAVVGTGYHAKAGEPHAEVFALQAAGEKAKNATVYVTLEPCAHTGRTPPCARALVRAQVGRVVIAVLDSNPKVAGKGVAILRSAGITVATGVCEDEARELNAGFLKTMSGELPFVRLKIASSIDGRTAMSSGESKWITGKQARADVQRLRALSGAIITGSGTILADDPQLNVRQDIQGKPASSIAQPLTVVLDRRARLMRSGLDFKIFNNPNGVIFTSQNPTCLDESAGQIPSTFHTRHFESLTQVLQVLRDDFEVRDVLVEAGATLASAFLTANLVDELIVYQAPVLLGVDTKPMVNFSLQTLSQAKRFCLVEQRMIGEDAMLRLRVKS